MNQLLSDIAASLKANGTVDALSDLRGTPITYDGLALRIARLHTMLRHAGIQPGDRIALCAKNSANWAATFIGVLTYGAVAVPILHDFKEDSIHHLVDHSDAKLLYIDPAIWPQLDVARMPQVEGFFDMETGRLIKERSEALEKAYNDIDSLMAAEYPDGVNADNFTRSWFEGTLSDLALINYTSGSTGMSKGVMLTYGNLASNARFATDNIQYLHPGDGMVSMLPLAHMFGMLVELIFPLMKGCSITFLGRVPSPKVLLDAFALVKPKLVVTVPLVVEKIVRSKVFPTLERQPVKTMLKIPGLRSLIYRKVRRGMIEAFGGNLMQLIIGGAAFNPDVERFLLRIRFPYTVGYGMTECAPLISYCVWDRQRQGSCGLVVDRMKARIDSKDPAHVPGVLWVKGDNVMKGYYKNPAATKEVMRDGWLNTGDICVMDPEGYLYIRGREKAMLLGPSGQNIYPEEIEAKLNLLPFVAESVVVERDGKLVALVYPDLEAAKKAHLSPEKVEELMGYNLATLNRQLPAYSFVSSLETRPEPFEKTPKQSIKRFLYT